MHPVGESLEFCGKMRVSGLFQVVLLRMYFC